MSFGRPEATYYIHTYMPIVCMMSVTRPIVVIELLRRLGRHARHILPPLRPCQPVNAGENVICWETFMKLFAFPITQQQHCTAPSICTRIQASTRRPERDKARKHTEFVRASSTSSNSYTARCVLKTKQEIKSARLTTAGVMLPEHCSFSPSFLFRPCMRRPGCFRGPTSSWHLQVAGMHLKPKTSLHASFISIWFNSSL